MWLHKKLREDLKTKNDTYSKWKESQATKEGDREMARNCRDGILKAKPENELRLARDTKSDQKKLSSGMCIAKEKEKKQ